MNVIATVKQLMDGTWLARSAGSDVGMIEASGGSRELALRELRCAIQERLARTPRGPTADHEVTIVARDLAPTAWRGTVF
jgi:hypothetical protein